jgi:hypothetical protein
MFASGKVGCTKKPLRCCGGACILARSNTEGSAGVQPWRDSAARFVVNSIRSGDERVQAG